MHRPEVVLLDEPTTGLDPEQGVEARALISALRGRHSVLLSSHLLPEVAAMCDRVLVIDAGRVIADEATADLLSRLSPESRSLEGAYLQVLRSARTRDGGPGT
jgi:ABC-2 type transport system ATP-binding protein